MKKTVKKYAVILLVIAIASCKQKFHRGDFSITVEKDKYNALGGALKINSYDVLYKGEEINWGQYSLNGEAPEIWGYEKLDFSDSCLLAEAGQGSNKAYYLLQPDGDEARVRYLANASSRDGLFESKPYTDLLNGGLIFHQAGLLINLQTLQKDLSPATPAGRLLATNKDFSNIIYMDGVFDDDVNLKKTLERANNMENQYYGAPLPKNYNKLAITKWDVKQNKISRYNYTDATLWDALNKHYDDKYGALSTSYDSSFVFNLFKWEKDSTGGLQLIPKGADIKDIKFIIPEDIE